MAAFSSISLDPTLTYWLLLKNGAISSFTDVSSWDFVDGEFYDGTTYSKIVGADILGNAHSNVTVQANSKAAQSQGRLVESLNVPDPDANNSAVIAAINGATGSLYTDSGGATTYSLPGGTTAPGPAVPAVLNGAETSYAPALLTDSGFVLDTTPGKTLKQTTMMVFKNVSNQAIAATPLMLFYKLVASDTKPDFIGE